MMVAVRMVVLAALFAAFTDPMAAGNWLVGLVAGSAVALALGGRDGLRRPAGKQAARRLVGVPRLLAAAALRIALGAWTMLAILLGRRGWGAAGLVDCTIRTESGDGLAVLGLIESASPGSLTIGIDRQRRSLLIHTVDARDPEATCATVRRFYRRHQAGILP